MGSKEPVDVSCIYVWNNVVSDSNEPHSRTVNERIGEMTGTFDPSESKEPNG